MTQAAEIVALLGLEPHPEGGYFKQMFADEPADGRAKSTAIYYLLEGGTMGRWHRVDAAEVWHFYLGAPLRLIIGTGGDDLVPHILGTHMVAGERPQVVVPPGQWQAAESLGEWTLVGCTVAPGFDFKFFEMAPEGWHPGAA